MVRYIVLRILSLIPVLFVVSFLVFMMLHLVPGDPVRNMLGLHAPPAAIEEMTKRLGLDQPLHIQYYEFLTNALRGDFGISVRTSEPVIDVIAARYPITVNLAIGATIFATVVGVLFGIISAVHRNKFLDNILMVLSLLAISTPSFFLALLAILIFSLYFGLLPSIGIYSPTHYILPILTLGAQSVGIIARMTRSAMLEVLNQDYIRTARAKGVKERLIVYSHALKNALIPVVTVVGLRFGGLLAGSALIEQVFGIRGIGRLLIDSVLTRDYPVVQATVLLVSLTFVVINLIVDIMYRVVDPRIKY